MASISELVEEIDFVYTGSNVQSFKGENVFILVKSGRTAMDGIRLNLLSLKKGICLEDIVITGKSQTDAKISLEFFNDFLRSEIYTYTNSPTQITINHVSLGQCKSVGVRIIFPLNLIKGKITFKVMKTPKSSNLCNLHDMVVTTTGFQ